MYGCTGALPITSKLFIITIITIDSWYLIKFGFICLCGCHLGLAYGSQSSGLQIVVFTLLSYTIFILLWALSDNLRGILSYNIEMRHVEGERIADLKFWFSRVQIHSSMVPSWPDSVVNAQKYHHVFSWKIIWINMDWHLYKWRLTHWALKSIIFIVHREKMFSSWKKTPVFSGCWTHSTVST